MLYHLFNLGVLIKMALPCTEILEGIQSDEDPMRTRIADITNSGGFVADLDRPMVSLLLDTREIVKQHPSRRGHVNDVELSRASRLFNSFESIPDS
jgi:hypothetical protein